jgi:hypothetical protein
VCADGALCLSQEEASKFEEFEGCFHSFSAVPYADYKV